MKNAKIITRKLTTEEFKANQRHMAENGNSMVGIPYPTAATEVAIGAVVKTWLEGARK